MALFSIKEGKLVLVQESNYCRGTQKASLFELLSDLKWHTTGELQHFGGHRFSALINEFRTDGYIIETISNRQKQYKYRLVSLKPGKPREPKIRIELSRSEANWLLSDFDDLIKALSDIRGLISDKIE